MIGFALVVFIIFDGLVRCNLAAEAEMGRGMLISALVTIWLIWLWRSSIRLPWASVGLIGILAAYAVSEAAHQAAGSGISSWLIYAGAYWGQLQIKRDWRPDLARAGLIMAGLIIASAPAGAPAGGMLNRNQIAGSLIVLIPAVLATPYSRPLAKITAAVAVWAALVFTGSRGAILAGMMVTCIMWRPSLAWLPGAAIAWRAVSGAMMTISGFALAGLMTAIRPLTAARRWDCLGEVVAAWLKSPLFGLGPVWQIELSWGEMANNAHSVLPSIVVNVGLAGGAIIAGSILLLGQRAEPARLTRWQWATLAGAIVHGLIEANYLWWPVGIVVALAVAGDRENA